MLVLVGLMGAGKSSVGKRLSEYLNVGFIDSDQEIEKASGMNIVEIFEKFGEQYFRAGERKVINRLILHEPQVLSTGGGAFISKEISEVIKINGFSIMDKRHSIYSQPEFRNLIIKILSYGYAKPVLFYRVPWSSREHRSALDFFTPSTRIHNERWEKSVWECKT